MRSAKRHDASARPGRHGAGVQAPGLLWGVGAVAVRLGIATPTLRTWERRYGIGPSRRTDGGHRRYTEDDIGRVELMQRLVGEGVPAQSAAEVAVSLAGADLEAALSAPEPPDEEDLRPPLSAPPVAVATVIRKARELDAAGLAEVYQQVIADFGLADAWVDVLVPALRSIGEQWADGDLGVEAEQLASYRLAAALHNLTADALPRTTATAPGPPVVLCAAGEDPHVLPLLALEALLTESGVRCVCLGPRLPDAGLCAAVARLDPPAVFMWASLPQTGSVPTRDLLASIDVPILVGGPGWPDDIDDDLEYCADLASASRRLRRLAG